MTSSKKKNVKGKGAALHKEKYSTRKLKSIGKPEDLIRRVQLGLNEDQYEVMKAMIAHTNSTFDQYVHNAVIGRIGADLDGSYIVGDSRREEAFKKLGEQR